MLGFRGASRYISGRPFRDCFELECRRYEVCARVMGLTNVEIMVLRA